MIAINCTQCGATLENVSERSKIIECEYCGARIMLPERAAQVKAYVPVVPVKPPDLSLEVRPAISPGKIGFGIAIAFLLPVVIITVAVFRSPKQSPPRTVAATPYATPFGGSTPSSWSWSANTANTSEKPLPVVNYQPRMSWDGPNDLEHFEDPEVDISSLSDLTSEEVEKTVFKNRVVKLRVVINTEGEIDQVETISGHPILVAAATESAKRSIFTSRSKPTKRVLTYTFRVLKD